MEECCFLESCWLKACNCTTANNTPTVFSRPLNCTNGTKLHNASQFRNLIFLFRDFHDLYEIGQL